MQVRNGAASHGGRTNGAVEDRHGPTPHPEVGDEAPVEPRSFAQCRRGVRDSVDVGNLMSDVLSDLANGLISERTVKAITKPCEVMIRNAIAEAHFGSPVGDDENSKILTYARDVRDDRADRIATIRAELAALEN